MRFILRHILLSLYSKNCKRWSAIDYILTRIFGTFCTASCFHILIDILLHRPIPIMFSECFAPKIVNASKQTTKWHTLFHDARKRVECRQTGRRASALSKHCCGRRPGCIKLKQVRCSVSGYYDNIDLSVLARWQRLITYAVACRYRLSLFHLFARARLSISKLTGRSAFGYHVCKVVCTLTVWAVDILDLTTGIYSPHR